MRRWRKGAICDACAQNSVRALRAEGQLGRMRDQKGNTQGQVSRSITSCRCCESERTRVSAGLAAGGARTVAARQQARAAAQARTAHFSGGEPYVCSSVPRSSDLRWRGGASARARVRFALSARVLAPRAPDALHDVVVRQLPHLAAVAAGLIQRVPPAQRVRRRQAQAQARDATRVAVASTRAGTRQLGSSSGGGGGGGGGGAVLMMR
jgi:hypothetical protein